MRCSDLSFSGCSDCEMIEDLKFVEFVEVVTFVKCENTVRTTVETL